VSSTRWAASISIKYGYSGELKIMARGPISIGRSGTRPTVIRRSRHPMVFVQPETGRKVLHISPFFAMYIEGMENPEGDALLKRSVRSHIGLSDLSPQMDHRGNSSFWGQLAGAALGHAPIPADEERVMQRTTIKGDYGARPAWPQQLKAA